MAILKKGSRAITVDGRTYYWRVRSLSSYSQEAHSPGLALSVASSNALGAILLVDLKQIHLSNQFGEITVPILPSQVARYIRQALKAGWQPKKQGRPFILNLSNADRRELPKS